MDYRALLASVVDFKEADAKTIAYVDFMSTNSRNMALAESVTYCQLLACLSHALTNLKTSLPIKALFKLNINAFGSGDDIYETDLYWYELAVCTTHVCERYVSAMTQIIKEEGCVTEQKSKFILNNRKPDVLGLLNHLMVKIWPVHLKQQFFDDTGLSLHKWATLKQSIENIMLFIFGYGAFHISHDYQLAAKCFGSSDMPGRAAALMRNASLGYYHSGRNELDLASWYFDLTPDNWKDKLKTTTNETIKNSILKQWDRVEREDDPRIKNITKKKMKVTQGVDPLEFHVFRLQSQ
jgi:hypothetical protein